MLLHLLDFYFQISFVITMLNFCQIQESENPSKVFRFSETGAVKRKIQNHHLLSLQWLILSMFQRIHCIDDQSGDSSTYNILSLLCISGMSFESKPHIGIIFLINCHCNHANTRLSVDLFDFNFCKLLSVTVFLVISSFSLVLVNDNFFSFTVFNYRSGNTGIFNIFQLLIRHCLLQVPYQM